MPTTFVEVDQIDKACWNKLIQRFEDANFYQTWSHGRLKWGGNLSHLVLREGGVVVAAAQITLVNVPVVRTGVAHIRFGPMWMLSGVPHDSKIYAKVLSALRAEYVERRGLLLRLKPWESPQERTRLTPIRDAECFRRAYHLYTYDTFVLDLTHTLEELYKGLTQKWRRDLQRAQDRHMQVEESTEVDAIDVFLKLYDEMHQRKNFLDFTDIKLLRGIHIDLPHPLKPHVMVCRYGNEPVAAIVFSLIGNKALALFGATSERGRYLGASYLINWEVVRWLKNEGSCRWYDLVGGLSTPGIRHFKAGLAKKCGKEFHMSDYDTSCGFVAPLTVRFGDLIRPVYQKIRARGTYCQGGRR